MFAVEEDSEPEGDPDEGKDDVVEKETAELDVESAENQAVKRAKEGDEPTDDHEEKEAARAQKAEGFLRTRCHQSFLNKLCGMEEPTRPVVDLIAK